MKTILALFALVPSLCLAQATRTWVSGVGDDANPCSRTAPGKTFAGAISKTAVGGVISILDPGGFGTVTITKAITIGGETFEGSILTPGAHGVVITAGTNAVVILRNLSIEGAGTGRSGVLINSAKAVHIVNCRIIGCLESGIRLSSLASNIQVYVKDTDIRECRPAGIWLSPTSSASVVIEKSSINGCDGGMMIGPKVKVSITDASLCGNKGAGILIGDGGKLMLSGSTVSGNLIGIQNSGIATIADSTIANNTADGVKTIPPGKTRSLGNNTVTGNAPNGTNYSLLLPW